MNVWRLEKQALGSVSILAGQVSQCSEAGALEAESSKVPAGKLILRPACGGRGGTAEPVIRLQVRGAQATQGNLAETFPLYPLVSGADL